MPITPQEALYGLATPLLVAAVCYWIASRFLSEKIRERWPASLALVVGFAAGSALMNLAPWQPTQHWHWMPYALALAALVGSISAAEGVSLLERALLYGATAWVIAWFVAPTYDDLEPSRMSLLIGWPIYVMLIALAIDLLARRLTGPLLPAVVAASIAAGVLIVFLSGTATLMQIEAIGMAAAVGIALVATFFKDKPTFAGAALPATVLSAGYLLVAKSQSFSDVPLLAYALPPLAPLALWLSQAKPIADRPGFVGVLLRILVPAIVCGVAVGLAIWAEWDSLSEL
ncbi:hypothetical protein [Blastopirellula retiformator]|uniref:Uncharacterized protein n=1 Tax=Blastopirellula retiformator TaxID=2527970 RepID=A0A5C5VKX2_9BACT|nr:hypothetical protein [Blastopirellula retiformator]TWT38539.1 hypothetical protein Enr8_02320 [Blastopirellula retiformator]